MFWLASSGRLVNILQILFILKFAVRSTGSQVLEGGHIGSVSSCKFLHDGMSFIVILVKNF